MPALQRFDRREDIAQDAVGIFPDVPIAISPDSVAVAFEPARSLFVAMVLLFPSVLVAIGLDDKAQFEADKIDDIPAKRMLPAEARTERPAPQMFPERQFRIGRVLAQISRPPAGQVSPPSLTLPRKGGGNEGAASGDGGQYVNGDGLPITSDPSWRRSA